MKEVALKYLKTNEFEVLDNDDERIVFKDHGDIVFAMLRQQSRDETEQ